MLLSRLSLLTSRRGGAKSPPGDCGPVSDEVTELLLAAREWTDNRPRRCPLELSGLSLVSLLSPGVCGRLASRGLYFTASSPTIGSFGSVSLWSSMPSTLSMSPRFIVTGNSLDRPSLEGEEGDHIIDVATNAGTMVAGLNAEFDRERVRLRELELGLGDGVPVLDSPGVEGRRWDDESSLSLSLLDIGMRLRMALLGFPRPPNRRLLRRLLMNIKSSRTSSITGFHSMILSSSIIAVLRLRTRSLRGIKILMKSFGTRRIIQPKGSERRPRMIEQAHCWPLRRVTENAVPPKKTIII